MAYEKEMAKVKKPAEPSEGISLEEKYQECEEADSTDNMSSCPIGRYSNDRKKE